MDFQFYGTPISSTVLMTLNKDQGRLSMNKVIRNGNRFRRMIYILEKIIHENIITLHDKIITTAFLNKIRNFINLIYILNFSLVYEKLQIVNM